MRGLRLSSLHGILGNLPTSAVAQISLPGWISKPVDQIRKRTSSQFSNDNDVEGKAYVIADKATEDPKKRFGEIIIERDPRSVQSGTRCGKSKHDCLSWYCSFLEERFQTIIDSHLKPCLCRWSSGASLEGENLTLLYGLICGVIHIIDSKDGVSLKDIIQKLGSQWRGKEGILRSLPADDMHLVDQLVFMTVGWLTMLYDPETSPSQEMLQILSRIRLSDNPLNTRSFHTFSQDCSLVGQPLSNLLQVFGNNIIPQSTTRQHQGTGGNANPYNSEYLILSYLNYRTLTMVANIRVEWVDTLSLHLEFDEEHRVLKVFRFPSFCRLIYAGSTDRTALCRLFSSRLSDDEVGFQSTSNLEPREFFREVLLSYRLLFSQDRGSRRTFRQEQRRRITRKDNDNIGTCDPLLLKLCGYRWQNERKLYEDLRAPDPHNYYSPVYDFPFLGQRLLELQRFSKGQNPHDWKLLWYDRRDIMRFYTFWAVLWIGGGTIILGILQIIVAVLQLAANYDQNRLQAISNGQRA